MDANGECDGVFQLAIDASDFHPAVHRPKTNPSWPSKCAKISAYLVLAKDGWRQKFIGEHTQLFPRRADGTRFAAFHVLRVQQFSRRPAR